MDWRNVPNDKLQELIEQVISSARAQNLSDEDDLVDHLLSNYSFPVPDDDDDEGWNAFYEEEDSPYLQYETAFWNAMRDGDKASDVNGDGDDDLAVVDTDNNGTKDTAIVHADSPEEEQEAVDEAEDALENKQTSTGKTEDELSDSDKLSDSRTKRIAKMRGSWGKTDTQKEVEKAQSHKSDCTCGLCKKYHLNGYSANGVGTVSDFRQKNILAALADLHF